MNTLSHLQPKQPAMRAVFPSFFPSYLDRPGCYYCYNYVSAGLPVVLLLTKVSTQSFGVKEETYLKLLFRVTGSQLEIIVFC